MIKIFLIVFVLIVNTAKAGINCNVKKTDIDLEVPGKVKLLCRWNDSNGNQRFLYRKYLDNKARQLYLRVFFNESFIDKAIVSETRSYINKDEKSKQWFIYKFNILNGIKLRLKINENPQWPLDEIWEVAPVDYVPDQDRRLLSLKSWDGLDFYSFYYLPTDKLKNCDGSMKKTGKKKVVVLLQGGTSSFCHEPEPENSMDITTANFLRAQGYLVLLANFRGKKYLSNDFRLTGIGHMYDNGVKDIVTALDALDERYEIDRQDIKIMGCSRGGHMAGLFATNLGDVDTSYRVTKTVVSSGILNNIQGALNYYQPLPENFVDMNLKEYYQPGGLDFYDYDWMGGAICQDRPVGIYSDREWERISQYDYWKGKRYLNRYPRLNQTVCKHETYKKNNPSVKINSLQGELLALAGYDEKGTTSRFAPLEFQSQDLNDKVVTILHPFGHCIAPRKKTGFDYKRRVFSEFLNGCEQKITQEMIDQLTEKIDLIYSCIRKYHPIREHDRFQEWNPQSRQELETFLRTYDENFTDCSIKTHTGKCLWQLYNNYKAFLGGINKDYREHVPKCFDSL